MGLMNLNGNFQENNYQRGGFDGDFVNAEAQDGSLAETVSLNNANFSTQETEIREGCKCFYGTEVLKLNL
jgi:hypothetical protein